MAAHTVGGWGGGGATPGHMRNNLLKRSMRRISVFSGYMGCGQCKCFKWTEMRGNGKADLNNA